MRPLEHCSLCDQPTGHAGAGEDSRFCLLSEKGPYCDQCDEARDDGMADALRWIKESTLGVTRDDCLPYRVVPDHLIDAKLAKLKGEP